MSRKFRSFLTLLWQSTAFWVTAMSFFGIIRFYGTDRSVTYLVNEKAVSFKLEDLMLTVICIGLGLGVVYTFVDFLYEKYIPKRIPLGADLLIKTGIYFIVTILTITATLSYTSYFLKVDTDFKIGWWINEKPILTALFFITISSVIFSFLKIAGERFGRGMFLKMLIGAYKNPKEEKRIFMFLDLKDSTTIAEHLGHHKYSQFIQDCFQDLNEVVTKYEAEIYQYVGDEAVLSWPYQKGLEQGNCIHLFFSFRQQLQSRKEHYSVKYNFYPDFKAGLHGGSLMVAEVGFVKKELAYHGDVINTAARIQTECNMHNVNLLLSENLLRDLHNGCGYASKLLGKVLLKGKSKEVRIHTIEIINGCSNF